MYATVLGASAHSSADGALSSAPLRLRLAPCADAKGSTVPSASDVTALESLICSNQKAAAKQIVSAVEAGGSQAQVGRRGR